MRLGKSQRSVWDGLKGCIASLFTDDRRMSRGFDGQPALNDYVDALPSPQNAVDCVPGWNHALPPECGTFAGPMISYEDARIRWCLSQFGSIADSHVLELGPLEGMHTYMLHQHKPAEICCIEANRLSFIRCLIVKELLRLDRARFLLGDFQKWLQHVDERYDLIVASGVLYHMVDPVRLLELMSLRSDAIYIWTHYFSEVAMPEGDPRRGAFSGRVQIRMLQGVPIRLHHRSYHEAWRSKSFCGGMYDKHSWMERDQILAVLAELGFDDIRIAHDAPNHEGGPSLSIFARRSSRRKSENR
jgi:hypothetical protein